MARHKYVARLANQATSSLHVRRGLHATAIRCRKRRSTHQVESLIEHTPMHSSDDRRLEK
eukprot:6201364-Pleurochrysis_carterae.AAC.1